MNRGCMIWKGVECYWEVQSLRPSLRTSVARPLGRPGYLDCVSWIVRKMTGISVAGCRQAQLLHAGAADWQRDWKKRGAWAAVGIGWLTKSLPPNHAISRSSRAIDIALLGSDRRTLRQWGAWETGALVVYDLSDRVLRNQSTWTDSIILWNFLTFGVWLQRSQRSNESQQLCVLMNFSSMRGSKPTEDHWIWREAFPACLWPDLATHSDVARNWKTACHS